MPRLTYKYDWKKIKEKALSKHQKEYKIGSVMDAVKKAVASGLMEDPYSKYENMKDEGITDIGLNASRGSQIQAKGGNVLEFDLAGSGFRQFITNHENLGGKDDYYKDDAHIPFSEIKNKNKVKVHWWNRINWPEFIRDLLGISTEHDIITQNKLIDEYDAQSKKNSAKKGPNNTSRQSVHQNTRNNQMVNQQAYVQNALSQQPENSQPGNTHPENIHPENIQPENRQPENSQLEDNQPELLQPDEMIRKRYGVNPDVDGLKDKKYIYVKNNTMKLEDGTEVNRRRYSMPGSQSWGGMRNRGEYSIANVSKYMLTAGIDYLKPFFDKWNKEGIDTKERSVDPVTVMIKGHSRGGVAASHGAMMIKNWISKNYPQYEDMVKFEITQLDPVAGLGSDHGVKHAINFVEEDRPDIKKEMEERGMKSLGNSAETTLIYSLHTDHPLGFAPQIVDGAKRIILTTTDHGVNIDDVDETQKKIGKKKSHRAGYMDLSTGEMYRSSGLNQLPEGIYIADENNCLIKIPSLEVGRSVIGEVLKKTSGQSSRHRRIDEVMDKWFKARSLQKDNSKEKVDLSKAVSVNKDKKAQKEKLDRTRTMIGNEKNNQKDVVSQLKRSATLKK